MCYIHFSFQLSPAVDDVLRFEPTIVEDQYGCYPYDTMDERRDIRCQVRSLIKEALSEITEDLDPDRMFEPQRSG